MPQRDARGQRRREHKRRDLITRAAGMENRAGLAGLVDYTSVRDAYQVEIEPAPASPPAHPPHVHDHAERTRA